MPLDNLKRELKEQRRRAVQLEQEKRRAQAEGEKSHREYQRGQIPALRCLQSLEGHFWACVRDFAHMANLKVAHTNRPKLFHLIQLPTSAATLTDPSLYASFACGGWHYNTARLQVSQKDALWFCAEYETKGHYSQGVAFPHESHVRVSDRWEIESFDSLAARKWLEGSFEDYYRQLMVHFNNRAV